MSSDEAEVVAYCEVLLAAPIKDDLAHSVPWLVYCPRQN